MREEFRTPFIVNATEVATEDSYFQEWYAHRQHNATILYVDGVYDPNSEQ